MTFPAKTTLAIGSQPGGMFSIEDMAHAVGNRFFVHAGTGTDGAGFGRNPQAPVATLDYAVGLCTANNDDIIYLLPGHAENVGSATACVLDIAGVRVIGLGNGALRPTLTITTATTATISITAANCTIENVLVLGGFLNVAAAITVAATATGTTLRKIETRDKSVILGALIQISVAALASDLTIDQYKHVSIAGGLTAAATNVILCAGAADRFSLTNSRIYCFTSAAAVGVSAAASVDVTVENVRLIQYETGAGLGIAFHNSSTGLIEDISGVCLKNNVKCITGTGLSVGARVMYSNAVNAYAGLFCYTIDS
jgi:hypothetical protein